MDIFCNKNYNKFDKHFRLYNLDISNLINLIILYNLNILIIIKSMKKKINMLPILSICLHSKSKITNFKLFTNYIYMNIKFKKINLKQKEKR